MKMGLERRANADEALTTASARLQELQTRLEAPETYVGDKRCVPLSELTGVLARLRVLLCNALSSKRILHSTFVSLTPPVGADGRCGARVGCGRQVDWRRAASARKLVRFGGPLTVLRAAREATRIAPRARRSLARAGALARRHPLAPLRVALAPLPPSRTTRCLSHLHIDLCMTTQTLNGVITDSDAVAVAVEVIRRPPPMTFHWHV